MEVYSSTVKMYRRIKCVRKNYENLLSTLLLSFIITYKQENMQFSSEAHAWPNSLRHELNKSMILLTHFNIPLSKQLKTFNEDFSGNQMCQVTIKKWLFRSYLSHHHQGIKHSLPWWWRLRWLSRHWSFYGHLTRLIAWEDFNNFSCHESYKS
jgi:hypothetical protein